MTNNLYPNGLKLHIRCRFQSFEHIICTYDGVFYQLAHCAKRTVPFRKLTKIKCGGSIGYRINRKFYTINFLRNNCIVVDEWMTIYESSKLPF